MLPEVPAMFEPPSRAHSPAGAAGKGLVPVHPSTFVLLGSEQGSAPSDLGNLLSFIFNSSFSSALFQSEEDTEAEIDPRL